MSQRLEGDKRQRRCRKGPDNVRQGWLAILIDDDLHHEIAGDSKPRRTGRKLRQHLLDDTRGNDLSASRWLRNGKQVPLEKLAGAPKEERSLFAAAGEISWAIYQYHRASSTFPIPAFASALYVSTVASISSSAPPEPSCSTISERTWSMIVSELA